eukprot:906967-Alexandrium_andersonii.AAC.1
MVAEQNHSEAARGELLSKVGELQKRLASMVSQNSCVDDLKLQARDLSAENAGLREQFGQATDDLTEWQSWYQEHQDWTEPLKAVPEEDPEEEFQAPDEDEAV